MKERILAAALAIGFLASGPAFALTDEEAARLSERLRKMEEEIALLKRQLEVKEEKEAAVAEKTANVEFGKKGLKVTSPDKKYELSVRGYFQLDNRHFIKDANHTGRNDMLARRLRPAIEAKAGDASFRLMPDFAGSSTRVFDAHADYKLTDAVQFRFGKFKPPIGLERLQSAADTFFIERGHPTNLAPNRDLGFMMYGNLLPETLEYQLGIFNGNADLANNDGDDDDKKDIVARVFAHPFRNADTVALRGLGMGAGGSIGDRQGSTSRTILGTYKSPGQQDFFRYRSDTFADGRHWRLYPQAYWYSGPFGLLAEYAISNQEVTRTAAHDELQHEAMQLAGSYVLTGEDVNFRGGIKPFNDFDFTKGGIGAWEIVARVGQTDVDNDTFSTFADPAVAASRAQSYGGGINWYLNENLRLMADYDFTQFDGGATGGDRADEHALFTRVQFRL